MTIFYINATPSTYNENTDMVMTMICQPIHYEKFEGTLDQAIVKMHEVKNHLIATRNFDTNCGFSIDAYIYPRSQRKPAGYDKRRYERCSNFINHNNTVTI